MKIMPSNTVLIILLILAGVALFVYQRRGRPDRVRLTETQQDPLYWEIMSLCRPVDECEVDTNAAVSRLSQEEDEVIFRFEDTLADLLALLNKLYNDPAITENYPGEDDGVLEGKEKDFWANESESVLYIAKEAWAMKHGSDIESFPHSSKDALYF